MSKGVDAAWGRPTAQQLVDAGAKFVIGYVSWDDTGKNITGEEIRDYLAHGIAVGLVWEWGIGDALTGHQTGVEHAQEAVRQARALEYPPGCCIWYAVDVDVMGGDLTSLGRYFSPVASITREAGYLVGCYGDVDALASLFDRQLIDSGWLAMASAWSHGVSEPRAKLIQVNGTTIAGHDVDWNIKYDNGVGLWEGSTMSEDTETEVHEIETMDNQPRNAIAFALRAAADSEDPALKEIWPDWTVPGPGRKQLQVAIARVEAAQRIGGTDLEVLKRAMREVLEEYEVVLRRKS